MNLSPNYLRLFPALISSSFIYYSIDSYADSQLFDFADLYPFAVSGNGSIVVGRNDSDQTSWIWTLDNGVQSLGSLNGGSTSAAISISRNGSVIVGSASDGSAGNAERAFRWTQQTGMVSLGTLNGGSTSVATGVSDDGNVVVGSSLDGPTGTSLIAFRWTQETGMISLGTLNGGQSSDASAVSANGNVVVGIADDGAAGNANRAFLWTNENGMISLGTLNGGNFSSATGISSNGNTVVGSAEDGAGGAYRAFRWTQTEGMISLGTLDGWINSYASGISGDGNVIVGFASDSNGDSTIGFRWEKSSGMQSVSQWLASAGISTTNFQFTTARATNNDGSVVVGTLDNGHGYIARVDNIGSGAIDVSDYGVSLRNGGAMLPILANQQADLVLQGAHSNPMRNILDEGKQSFWIGGDIGRQDHNETSGNNDASEIGYAIGLGKNTTVKVALGRTYSDNKTAFEGKTYLRGTYILPEVIFKLPNTSLYTTLSAYYNSGEADINRGYINAGQYVKSSGSPDVTQTALRARIDWLNAFNLQNIFLTPYASLTYSHSRVDSYTENGGGFPSFWDKHNDYSTQIRFGLDGVRALTEKINLIGRIETAHRTDDRSSKTSGYILGLSNFELPGVEYKQNWWRASLGAEGIVGPGIASLILSGTTEASTPSTWLYGSYRWLF